MKSYSISLPNCVSDVQVIGRVTRDVEMRYTPAGDAVANVSLALSRRWLPKDSQEWKEQTVFVTYAIWGEDAAGRAAKLHKGDIAVINFSMADLRPEKFEGTDGSEKLAIKVNRAQVYRLGWAGEGSVEDSPIAEEAPAEEAAVSFN